MLIIERKLYIRVVVQGLYAMLLAATRVGCQTSHLLLKANEHIFKLLTFCFFLLFFSDFASFLDKTMKQPKCEAQFPEQQWKLLASVSTT